jgi:hypothetical protein
MDQIDSK